MDKKTNKKIIILSLILAILLIIFCTLFIVEKNEKKVNINESYVFAVLGDVENTYDFMKEPNKNLSLKDILKSCGATEDLKTIYFIARDGFAISISGNDISNISLKYYSENGYNIEAKNLPKSVGVKGVIEIIVIAKEPNKSKEILKKFKGIYKYDVQSEKEINNERHIVKQYKKRN